MGCDTIGSVVTGGGGGIVWSTPIDANVVFDSAGTWSIGDATNYGLDFFFNNWKSGTGQDLLVLPDVNLGITLNTGTLAYFEGDDFQFYGLGANAGKIGLWDGGGANFLVSISAPAAATASWTFTLPPDAGTNGYFLQTNGSGVTSWVAAGGGGANTTLSNLGTVSLNANLYPSANYARELGSGLLAFNRVYTGQLRSATGDLLEITSDSALDLYSGGGNDITFTSDANVVLDASANSGKVIVYGSSLRLPNLGAAPVAPSAGDMYFDTGTNTSYTYDGTTWQAHW